MIGLCTAGGNLLTLGCNKCARFCVNAFLSDKPDKLSRGMTNMDGEDDVQCDLLGWSVCVQAV